MSRANPICSDAWLESWLQADERLTNSQEFVEHIDNCLSCQLRLETLVAGEHEWEVATESLRGDPEVADYPPDRLRGWKSESWITSMAEQVLAPPSHPEMLGRIGRYDVERIIGSGGMGIVFKAFDTELNRPVAVKVLAPFLAGSGAARSRFAREARAAAAVVHEHVVAIHNVESKATSPFLVMPLVVGESLQQRIDREGSLELCEILRIAMQTALGLAAAHEQGLVHRDVKPSNILLEHGVERALLTDFGLARASDDASLTHTGYHPGTPQYMSPEQARGDSVDARSDLFSLGSVIYTMCTGRPPFRGETSYGILRRITDDQPRGIREINPAIPAWLCEIVGKLHAKTVADRFQSSLEVAELLKQCLAHVQQPTAVALPLQFARKANSHLKVTLAVSLCALIVAVTVAISVLLAIREDSGAFAAKSTVDATKDAESPKTNKATTSDQAYAVLPSSMSTPVETLPSLDWSTLDDETLDFNRDLERLESDTVQSWIDFSSAGQELKNEVN